MDRLLHRVAELAAGHLAGIDRRPAFPQVTADELRAALDVGLTDEPVDADRVVEDLARAVAPGLVAGVGGRYFGFVTGGTLPASLAADWLTSAWDQNAFGYVSSPAAAVVEEIAAGWVLDVLDLPRDASVAFVTGCQMAHVTCLAAARDEVLRRAGWSVSRRGLCGAPPVRVVAGAKRHVTVDRALRLLGLGSDAIDVIPADDQGRIRAAELAARLDGDGGPTIVVAQAGEVNTGAFDPFARIAEAAERARAWLHVDGAFGMWARANPATARWTEAVERADSWAFDAHKWLNVPYDSGVAICADPRAHRAAMLGEAAYLLPSTDQRDAMDWTPEASRRARGIPVYAALRSLGRDGVAALVERCCALARRFRDAAADLSGVELLNDVVLNQVLFRFENDDRTARILRSVQAEGVAWMGSTQWAGRLAIRLSVSSWRTDEDDIDRTVASFERAVAGD